MRKRTYNRWIAGAMTALLSAGLAVPAFAVPADDPHRFTAGDPVDVFEPLPNSTDHTHGSGIAVLPDGELLCVWFQGNGERDGTTTRIMGSRLPEGAKEWTEPFVMADTQGIADINPTIYVDSSGRLWMFWYPVLSAMWETSQPKFSYAEPGSYEYTSVGNCAPEWTWSDTIPIKIGDNIGGVIEPDKDEFVLTVKEKFQDLMDYTFNPVNSPEEDWPEETTGEELFVPIEEAEFPEDVAPIEDEADAQNDEDAVLPSEEPELSEDTAPTENEAESEDREDTGTPDEETAILMKGMPFITGNASDEDLGDIYEGSGNTSGGVNAAIEEERRWNSFNTLLKKIGGDPNEQSFAPTVADKVGPKADGTVERSGYPLLRRIGWQTKNPPLEIELPEGEIMSNGEKSTGVEHRLILPLYSDGLGMSINAITDDGGQTWMMSEPLVGISAIQASMAQRENGDIVALMRNNGPVPYRAAYAISEDYGMSWSTVKLRHDLLEPGVGNCLTELPNGHWVFVSTGVDNEERGVMSIALSEDEGKTWPFRRTIELDTREKDTNGKYHYPSVVADDDNNIYITYSIDYGNADAQLANYNNIRFMQVDEDWIKEGDWSEEDDTNKVVFCYEYSALDLTLPEDVDRDDTGAVVDWLAEALPDTIKGYLTYNNHDGKGLDLAAPEYVEIPVTVDKDELRNKLQIGEAMEDIPLIVDTENLPEGIVEEMLPEYDPCFCKLLVQEA